MRGALVLGVLFAMACKPPPPTELHRLELPGFTIDVPAYVKAVPDLHYNDDEVDAAYGLQRVTILWRVGSPIAVAELEPTIGKAMAEAMDDEQSIEWDPAREITIGGHKAGRLDGGIEGLSTITVVDVGCGGRSVMLTLAGLGIRGFRERMLDSFTCKPIPAEEAKLATAAPIGSDDPSAFAGFRHLDDNPANFTITNDELTGTFELEHRSTDDLAHLQEVLAGMHSITSKFTVEGKPETRAGRTYYRGAVAIDRETTRLAVASILRCDPQTAVFGVVIVDTSAQRGQAIDWLAKLRCAKPTDPPLALAPATSE